MEVERESDSQTLSDRVAAGEQVRRPAPEDSRDRDGRETYSGVWMVGVCHV